ncbi:hypothetical protein FIBSPDRAFT_944656 [Athelia psychrophila]|uniref:Uncharacterized protein n=1 Tax=Athelia psychrophila TaxID=1759441 RepID=A0A166UVV8_9AGAM|nr:hypothetical protein FIBSPDRAFT_944656 [Fibularhizoctonia sp. CBS 109695]
MSLTHNYGHHHCDYKENTPKKHKTEQHKHKHEKEKDEPPPNNSSYGSYAPLWSPTSPRTTMPPPSHAPPCAPSRVWDAQTELRATGTDTKSPRPARLPVTEMQAGNLPYTLVRAIGKQEIAAAASLSPKQARAEHSVTAVAAFADKGAAAAAIAKNHAAQWAAQAALRSTEVKAAHLAAIEARKTTLARRTHCKVEPFGSTAYGVCSPSSDLDLDIIESAPGIPRCSMPLRTRREAARMINL